MSIPMDFVSIAIKYDIPPDELKQVNHLVKILKKGDLIVAEGDLDRNLYLIRYGSVAVYRDIAGTETLLTFIGSVNFVGEIEILTGGARLSTVKVYSDEAVVYVFENPDIEKMIRNNRWGMTLVRRLSSDLKFFSNRIVEIETEAKLLREKIEKLNEEKNTKK
ncbi:MAG: cyclic nucleotide-binding domain-containing protein [Anaerolineaceae bacterium]|nr:cyclic nucleotide-binding domain-containing protein [Anaerolineaceae bacterium]